MDYHPYMYVVRKHYSSSLYLTWLDLSCIYTVVHMQVKECFIGNNALLILMAYTWLVAIWSHAKG